MLNSNQLKLWYDKPANQWTEALPVGNGRLGGMVFGGIGRERLALNEDSLWSGAPREWDNPHARETLPAVRQAVTNGHYEEADRLAKQMQGPFTQSYMPLGDLILDFPEGGKIVNYYRDLNLENAITTTRYTLRDEVGEMTTTREVFVSVPDQVSCDAYLL